MESTELAIAAGKLPRNTLLQIYTAVLKSPPPPPPPPPPTLPGALFISAQLSSDVVSALRKVRVLI